jgi:PAS domain S-box-containing protein
MIISSFKKLHAAIKVLIVYLVFGSLWVIFSDSLLDKIISHPERITQWQTIKGLFFMFVTSILLYYLVRRYFNQVLEIRRMLDDSSRHYSSLFANNPQAMWVTETATGKILEANESACREYGYSQDEFLSMRLQDLSVSEVHEQEDIEKFLSNNRFVHITNLRHRRRDGQHIDVELMMNLLPKKDNEPLSCLVMARDVSERKKAFESLKKSQKAYRESERQLRTLMENLPGMVYRCLVDEDLTMVFAGGNCYQLTGYQCWELLHNRVISYSNILHPKDRDETYKKIRDFAKKKGNFSLEYSIITASGEIKQVREHAQSIFDEEGNFLYLEGFITDITQQRKNEKELKYYGDFLKNIINNIPFPLFYRDLHGKFLGCNQEFCRYLGKDYDEIIGHTVQELLSGTGEFYESGDEELIATGQQQKYETRIMFPDGSLKDAIFYKSLFYGFESEPEGIIGVYLDISERTKAEATIKKQVTELERINKELERFTYTVSHDLRSPLVTIKGFIGMLHEDILEGDTEQVEMDIQRISSAADKMQNLLEDLLQLSRIGRVSNPFTRFAMTPAAEEVIEYIQGIVSKTGCHINIQPDMPEVYGDRARIMEVLQNLVENAVKFKQPNQPIEIEIGCRENEPDPVFYVKDNGKGIETQFQKKIFGLFNKLDPHTSGTGIGLALAHRIIEFHGGSLWVESEGKDKGSSFCFTLNTIN